MSSDIPAVDGAEVAARVLEVLPDTEDTAPLRQVMLHDRDPSTLKYPDWVRPMIHTDGEICYEWQTAASPLSHYAWWSSEAEGGVAVAIPRGYVISGLPATAILRDVIETEPELLTPTRRNQIPVARRVVCRE